MSKYISLLIISCCATNFLLAQQSFQKLNALTGLWRMETKKGPLYESWQQVNDSVMKGISYRLNQGDTMILEIVSLVKRGAFIYYIPNVEENKREVVFTLRSTTDDKYVFENPAHDFPQRIVYELPRGKVLHAWIEGKTKDGVRRSDYSFMKQE